jgi:galactofuranosylgalactofuranosylrhamnosyl-N-acetylglucosaminyl-diphospho-decaprenol beta-1,5/1,6-galactofuranosyltransferase
VTDVLSTASEADPGAVPRRVVQRVVLPANQDIDLVPLYIDPHVAGKKPDSKKKKQQKKKPVVVRSVSGAQVHPDDILSRRSVRVRAGERLSFGSYFNAFPASYWRRWTDVETVRLTVRTEGQGSLIIYRSNGRGSRQRVDAFRITETDTTELDLSLTTFGDGGWYWFDLVAGADGLTLLAADWSVQDASPRQGTITIGITTFNRPDYCLQLLDDVATSEEILSTIDQVIVVDQGTRTVAQEEGFEQVEQRLGGRLTVIYQPNLGGSGGFARSMYEAAGRGLSTYLVLLDDDITLEAEGLPRLVAFADYCRTPTIVGGHMFDMYNKSVLHAFGEVVNMWRIQPALPHEDMELAHDFAESGLRSTDWLHRRADVDYNGWWMCLIPVEVIRAIGLSLPLFIKWDDVEYGLRARDAGYPTVTLPGAAVWHVSWGDKDDLVGWQSYFHERNRLIVALLYSPYERGGRLIRESSYMDVKHLISMQYYTEHGRLLALRDTLKGPVDLHPALGTKLGEIRSVADEYPDGRSSKRLWDFPQPKRIKPPRRGRESQQPASALLPAWTVLTLLRHTLKPPFPTTADHPQVAIPHQDNTWWRVSHLDSALVSNAEGTAVSWYQRDPATFRTMLREALALHGQLLANWVEIREQYRRALPALTSVEQWETTFGLGSQPR